MAASFVGRHEELDLLEARLASVRQGAGSRIVLIEGESGVGKSALLAAFLARLTDADALVVSGDDAESELDFGLCRQLIVLAESEEWPDSFAAGAALIRMVDEQPEDKPVVIIVDDAHLADPASLRALTFALRRLSAEPVLTVVSARSESRRRLPSGLIQLADGQDGHLVLAGLNVDDVIELAGMVSDGQPSRRLAVRLLEHTEGNPLYLRALLSEYPVAQLQTSPDRLPPPRSFALLVADWLGATSPAAQRVAFAAAVIGDGAGPEEIALVVGVTDTTVALEELQRARILRLRSGAEGWQAEFEHPLVRTSVYEAAGPATRAELHTRAAHVLADGNALNHLVAAASRPDATLAASLEDRSRAQRRADALTLAADSMFAAARLSADAALAERRFLDAVELLLLSGDIVAALAYAERVDGFPVSARQLSVQARMAWLSGQLAEAEEMAVRAWDMADGIEPVARDALAAMLAQLMIMRDQGAAAVVWAREALTSGRLPPEQAGATRAAAALGLMISGKADEGRQVLGDLDPDPSRVEVVRHRELRARGIIRLVTDDLAGARADLEVCSSVARRALSPSRLTAIGALAETEYRLGHWDASLALAEQSLSLVEDTEQFWLQGQIHSVALLVLAGRGKWEAGQRHLLAAQQMAALLEDPATVAYADNAAVHLAMCQSDAHGVLQAAERLARSSHGGPHEPGILAWPVHHVAALVEVGRLDEAESTLRALDGLARDRGSRSRLAAVSRVRGELCARRRERASAREAFETALALGDGASDALESAVAHAAYGRFLRRRGERRAAAVQLQRAYDTFVWLGAVPFAERSESELFATGLSPRQSADIATATLTPQEQVVARLVCTGRSNREVADELVLSVKTVSYHLGNVYTKLDIHSRAQLINHPAMSAR